ncbi:hypothetical protein KUTeg_021362 [Tegillarca granosa]|uniref:TIR domain-containing protein n=1 Tax=Tegillarca granosa TaxID=220873 RepID=A0ABQ9EB26_TEGGR|nr:hypothetical protein KUTeg_021362 [Tegillarca granosa]
MDHLKVLDLSNNMCSYVDENSFNGNKLLQTLNLSNNLLGFTNSVFGKKSNISLFRNLSKLQILNLSQNRIKYLHRNVFLGLSQLKSLDISDNGIRKWGFKMRHMKHLDDINLSGNRIRYIQQDYGYNKCDNLLSDDDNFEFDAFISYANEDRNFVTTELIRHLEDQGGCKLCLHERDFEIGKPIAASIANAVNTSKKTIIILSEHFLKSDWCIFEFNMARMESLCSRNGRDVVFVILYGHIKMSNVPLEIMELMSTNTYKEYTTDQHGNILFWEKNEPKCQSAVTVQLE